LLPEGILDYFDLINVEKDSTGLRIYLEEKNLPPQEYKDEPLEVSIQDFPIRGQKVSLCVKRRRWTVLNTGKIINLSFFTKKRNLIQFTHNI